MAKGKVMLMYVSYLACMTLNAFVIFAVFNHLVTVWCDKQILKALGRWHAEDPVGCSLYCRTELQNVNVTCVGSSPRSKHARHSHSPPQRLDLVRPISAIPERPPCQSARP